MNEKKDIESEIFNLLVKYPYTVTELAIELNKSKQNINYYLRKLKAKKAIKLVDKHYYLTDFMLKNLINNTIIN